MTPAEIRRIAGETDTPAYIYNTDEFNSRAESVKRALGERTELCYSVKANPFLLAELPPFFSKVEVCSYGELSICKKLGVDAERIIFSGVNKRPHEVAGALDYGVAVITAESLRQLESIEAEAEKRGMTVSVLLRIAMKSQFGMDEKEIMRILSKRERYPHLRMEGIHYFTGTQKRNAKQILAEIGYLSGFMDTAERETGYRIPAVEYGTGLPVFYFDDNAEKKEADMLDAISGAVHSLAPKCRLTVEMGRYFAAPCGYYVTTVEDVKTNGGINYAICDGGINQLKYDGQILGMQTPRLSHIKTGDGGEQENWTLCGSLCTTADILAADVSLTGLSLGDRIVFHRVGAYSLSEGMTMLLSREMPSVWLYSEKDGLQCVRLRMDTDVYNTPQRI